MSISGDGVHKSLEANKNSEFAIQRSATRHTDKQFGQRIADKPKSICLEAHGLVTGDRAKAYGSPAKSFQRIADLWSIILETDVSIQQVGLCMMLMKVSRETGKHKRDNLVDIAGYAEAMHMAMEESSFAAVEFALAAKRADLSQEEDTHS